MTIEADAEYERVRRKYAPARPRDLVIFALVFVLTGVMSIFRQVDWGILIAVTAGAAAWEITKFRLRRNARQFAEGAR